MHGVEQAKRFGDARDQEMLGILMRVEAVDIDIPEIEGRLAFGDPMRECHACTATGLNADGVKARSNKHALHFRCWS